MSLRPASQLAPTIATLLVGCGFHVGGAPDGGGSDAPRDTPSDAPSEAPLACYGSLTGIVRVCVGAPPPPTFVVDTATTINTDTATCAVVTGANTAGTCVIIAEVVQIKSTLTVIGSKPLVLVATDRLEMPARIDVASHLGGTTGAGASVGPCNQGLPPGPTGGGAGGSFTGLGGGGGGTAGGSPGPIAPAVTTLRGGCAGQRGSTLADGGTAGQGGGGVYLIAGTSILVAGAINASGAGANGAPASVAGGGGGGGSGGMIVLDAPTIEISGKLFANGGSGGEGADGGGGNPGEDSADAQTLAEGGIGGNTNGGEGGDGTVGTVRTGDTGGAPLGTPGGAGGGGGGGSAGFIRLIGSTVMVAGTISPPQT